VLRLKQTTHLHNDSGERKSTSGIDCFEFVRCFNSEKQTDAPMSLTTSEKSAFFQAQASKPHLVPSRQVQSIRALIKRSMPQTRNQKEFRYGLSLMATHLPGVNVHLAWKHAPNALLQYSGRFQQGREGGLHLARAHCTAENEAYLNGSDSHVTFAAVFRRSLSFVR
jgi:hypothetical protein